MHRGDVIIVHPATIEPLLEPQTFRSRLMGRRRRTPLPSLYDRHPRASQAIRRARGLQIVPIDQIVGTVRHPTQNTSDFRPLPELRGKNWQARWQRIRRAVDDLSTLPEIDVVQIGDEYYVADGHNRVAAARAAGAVAIDADVTELTLPGAEPGTPHEHHPDVSSLLVGADELRQAAAGRQSRTAEHRSNIDEIRRERLTDLPDEAER